MATEENIPTLIGHALSKDLAALPAEALLRLTDTDGWPNETEESATAARLAWLDEVLDWLKNSNPYGEPKTVPLPVPVPTLRAKWHYKGFLLYSEYYFECWVEQDGQKFPCPEISLRWRHGDTRGQEVGYNTAMVAKQDRTYNLGTDTDLCIVAVAKTATGLVLSVSLPEGCSIA
jgi:hypothetical protein